MQGLDRAVGERLPTPVEPGTLSRSFFVILNMQGLNFLRVDLERGRSTARMSQFRRGPQDQTSHDHYVQALILIDFIKILRNI